MASATAGTNGFLFCDLRGYAAFVDRHGDAAAAELLATYRGLVREVIAAHAGAEIRTEGDSVYVVFPTASAAVEAGLGITVAAAAASTAERPIRVGVGIHAGETVATGEGPVGGAVNTAARVCAKAQAGEVLVTDTVRSLTRTLVPYRFVGLGPQRLKGIGPVGLYRVEASPGSALAHLRRRLAARRGLVAAAALLVVGVLVGGTAAWSVGHPADCLVLGPETKDVLARIDPARACVVATYAVGLRPGPIVISHEPSDAATEAGSGPSPSPGGHSYIWVGDTDSWTISRIDAATGRREVVGVPGRPLSLSAAPDGDLVALVYNDHAGASSMKSSRKWLAYIRAAGPGVLTDYELPILVDWLEVNWSNSQQVVSGFARAVVLGDRVLVTNQATGHLARCALLGSTGICSSGVDTNLKLKPAPSNTSGGKVGAGTDAIAVGGGAAWVGDRLLPSLYRYDGASVTEHYLNGTAGTAEVAATERTIWLLRMDGSLTGCDLARPSDQSTVTLEGQPTLLAATADAVWVGDPVAHAVRRVDASTGRTVAAIATGGAPGGIAIAQDGSVWVTIAGR